jgi:hypothetical protein
MELRAIDRTDRGIGRLHKALSIYRETILPEAQNPEPQILYWIDHFGVPVVLGGGYLIYHFVH